MDLLCFCSVLCLLCLCARLFICALRSPAGKGLTSWLSFVVSLRVCHFPIGILGQVLYLIVSIPDLCTLTYSVLNITNMCTKLTSYAGTDLSLSALITLADCIIDLSGRLHPFYFRHTCRIYMHEIYVY